MKEFQNIGKRMPYNESGDYVRRLVSRATEQALSQRPTLARRLPLRTSWLAAAAVALMLIAAAGATYYNKVQPAEPQVAEQTDSPIDHFLDGLTDDEAQLLAYYELDIDEIPEY